LQLYERFRVVSGATVKARSLLRKSLQPAGSKRGDTLAEQEDAIRGRKVVLCRRCGREITLRDNIVVVDGSTDHTFFNQAGVVFEVICFNSVFGCITHGSPSDEFTWFPGYAWQIASCINCQTHLGWLFSKAGTSFWTLIKKTIRII